MLSDNNSRDWHCAVFDGVRPRSKTASQTPRSANPDCCYPITSVGIGTARCLMECGLVVKPQVNINDAPAFDTIIVPGGSGIHDGRLNRKIAKWLCRRAP